PIVGYLVSRPHAPYFMSWAGFLFDSSIPWLLLHRRTRLLAYAFVLLFHLVTRTLFPIGMFPVIMVLSALVFFPASFPRALLRVFRPNLRSASPVKSQSSLLQNEGAPPVTSARLPLNGKVRVALALGVAYCAFQAVFPLRFLAYGGNVRWHEQGMRFSWRVMVREKNGALTFVVRQKSTGRVYHVSPRRYLTRLQEREMSAQPDLILQLAHHVRDDFRRRGLGDVEVRADSWVSLNGRRMARLVNPDVDLTSVEDGLARAGWILPAPDSPPPRVRVNATSAVSAAATHEPGANG
ncbi:MAG TPA: HTTM domain-containing protein, partial [Polyangiaceae bacterium]|nr:HTTM domain-containing protein [Polyangiaceae bacterium]